MPIAKNQKTTPEDQWAPNPASRLEKGFERIRNTRMLGMPMVHPLIGVKAVGFRRWKYFWLGIMVTPWSINVILTKGDPLYWKSVPEGKKLHYRFPAGLFDFISVHDNILGEFQMCSLISPLTEIKDHEAAVAIAEASLDELMKPEQEDTDLGTPLEPVKKEIDTDAIEHALQKTLNRPIRRRSFVKTNINTKEQ